MDPLVMLTDVDRATENLLSTAADLDPAVVSAPSLLPGWTVGHVLTHVARNADAYTNLLTWARTGVETPAYASPEAREEAITAGAAMPAQAWTFQLDFIKLPAAGVPWARLREVEVHHVDLGQGYTPADWSDAFALRLLREIVTTASPEFPPMILRPYGIDHPLTLGTADEPPVVGGPTKSLAAWLSGRGDGADLTVSPDGELPIPARWK